MADLEGGASTRKDEGPPRDALLEPRETVDHGIAAPPSSQCEAVCSTYLFEGDRCRNTAQHTYQGQRLCTTHLLRERKRTTT